MMTAGDESHRDAAALYERERDRIRALCLAILRDRDDAEDAMQETFVRVSARLALLDGDVTGYLVTVARNICRDELRRRHRREPIGEDAAREVPASEPAVEDTVVERAVFGLAWRRLGQGDRTVLSDVARGLSHAEIAERVGVSIDVAAQRISRARRRIRRIITAPALVVLPLADRAIAAPLRRLGQAPANALAALAGDATQREPVTGPFLVAIIAGSLAMPAAPWTGTAPHSGSAAAVHAATTPAAAPAAHTAAPGTPARLLAQVAPSARPTRVAPAPVAAHNVDNGAEGVHVTAFTPSPDYGNDHTVFATTDPATCTIACSGLYRSDDGGSTWHAAGGNGLDGGALALPPQYPADTHIYAVAPWTGVLRSDDGGAHFHSVLALGGGVAALDPTSPNGDARFFAAVQNRPPLLLYDDASTTTQVVPSLPPDTQSISAVFTGPGSDAVYVNLLTTASGSALYACTAAAGCHPAGPALAAVPVMSPTFGTDRTFFVREPQAVVVRSVDGSSSVRLSLPGQPELLLPAADYAASQRLDVVSAGGIAAAPLLTSLFLVAAGIEHRVQAAWTSSMDLATATRLPDGRVLVALRPDPVTHVGVYGAACSVDDGASWRPQC
jgi:RNA polymerase sigma factor (sigma-70 family)